MRIIHNKLTNKWEAKPTLPDEKNWEKSFIQFIKDSDMMSRKDNKTFARYELPELYSIKINDTIRIQYYIYVGLANDEDWIFNYLPKGSKLHKDLKEISNHALSELHKFFGLLMHSATPEGSHPYTKNPKLKNYSYFKIDNFNRLTYSCSVSNKLIYIDSIMFHHGDPIDEKGKFDVKHKRFINELFIEFMDTFSKAPTNIEIELDSILKEEKLKLKNSNRKHKSFS